MTDQIQYHAYKDQDLSESIVIVGFPTTGLVGTISTNFIIKNRDLDRVGAFLSDEFTPAAKIKNGRPIPPVAVFSGENLDAPNSINRLTVITSETPINKNIMPKLADKIIEWSKEQNCTLISSIEGFQSEQGLGDKEPKIFHIGSIDNTSKFTDDLSTEVLSDGMVGGISGLLLYKSELQNYPVITLIGEAHKAYPDSRSAAKIIQVLNKLIPGISMDTEPLMEEAEEIESQIKQSFSKMQQQRQKEQQGQRGGATPYSFA